MTRMLSFAIALRSLMVALALLPCALSAHGAMPGGAKINAEVDAKKVASRPNIDLSLYRRSFTPNETATLRLSSYNVHAVRFTLYRLNLPMLIPTSKALENFGKTIGSVRMEALPRAGTWNYPLSKIYPDQWAENEVKIPHASVGIYLIVAQAGSVEKRTWYAVTQTALVAKRSRQEMLVFAASAHGGTPQPGLPLTLTDEQGKKWHGVTDAAGVWRTAIDGASGNLWVYGEKDGNPAFILSGAPPAPDPFTVYAFTDRPIYRPGQMVQYTGTIRKRQEALAPGGFSYEVYANRKAQIEIRDATDALIARQDVTTNSFGTFSGSLSLAAEPPLGRWQLIISLGAFRAYESFDVQAYRKPEYTTSVQFPEPHFLGGSIVPVTISAQYFFGQPVAHAAVQYTISFSGEGQGTVEPNFTGQGMTDAQGKLDLQIKTQRHPVDREVSVSATVTDLSRRSQSGAASALITAGAFRLTLQPDKAVYKPGETVRVAIHAEDYNGKPVVTPAKVQLVETKYDRQHRPYAEKTTRQVTTNTGGAATAMFTPLRPGDLQITAEAFDGEQDKIAADGSLWVAGDDYEEANYSTLDLVADKPGYRPGEDAIVLLNTSLVTTKTMTASKAAVPKKGRETPPPIYSDAWALVTLEGERLYRSQMIHLTGRSTTLRVPLTETEFPSVSLHVTIVQEKHIYEQQIPLSVVREAQKLRVTVTSDKAQLTPGQPVSYIITTRDFQNRPVAAEVALGVVDAAIYAIEPDSTANIEDAFYSGQQVRMQTDFSFAAQYSGGAYQTMASAPSASPGGGDGIRVRRLFADTAYWNPFVDTDTTGTAKITFTTPDNLTTWRATARGITPDTRVGSATQDTVSTMPLLIRLELPRFSVQGDDTVVSAIVQNDTATARTVRASLQSSGVTMTSGAAQQILSLLASGQQRLDWRVHILSPVSARFLATADGGAGGQDATESTLSTLPDGLKMVQAQADVLSEANAVQTVRLADLPPGATLTLSLAPSIGSALFDALQYLQTYPYGCAEQTMSSFLPDVLVARTLHRLHVNRPVRPGLESWVGLGLQKLYRYQHADGGWNWWEFDQTDGDMTAYVLWGLIQARDAGYVVDDQRIARGTNTLRRLLAQEQDPSRRADWLLTLAFAAPKEASGPLLGLMKQQAKLDIYGQASLCLALAQAGQAEPARIVARALAAKAVIQGTTVSWTAEEGGYSWREDDVAVTAHVLRALLTAQPASALAPGAVRWLMAQRDGLAWHSTKTSAEVVCALAQYLEGTQELHPAFAAQVSLDHQQVQTLTASDASAFAPPMTVTLTPEQMRGHTTLAVTKTGPGFLYITRTENYLVPPEQVIPLHHGLSVTRLYEVPAADPSRAGTITSAQEMDVHVDVMADANYRYAMLEEPIPAGCEVAGLDEAEQPQASADDGSLGYVRQEVRDSKVVFFFDALPKGVTHLSYRLHAETPGAFRILPGIASLTYFPEIRGNTGLAKANIEDAH